MPEEPITLFEMADTSLMKPVATRMNELLLESLVERAKEDKVEITLENVPGKPFKIINKPGGIFAWGIGGCGID